MKNVHVIPTDKPSRLVIDTIESKLYYQSILHNKTVNVLPQNIYITNDEEIKEDYVIAYGVVIKVMMFDKETLYFVNGTKAKREECKKIILTTDQDLIKDGVQAISDEFLEWFVQNPSCEFVKAVFNNRGITGAEKILKTFGEYKITIPSEEPNPFELPKSLPDNVFYESLEPKQETTLEKYAESYAHNYFEMHEMNNYKALKQGFKAGAKWQQERRYSEEEVLQFILTAGKLSFTNDEERIQWFTQVKKK